jgi:hypothetical protein
VFLEQELRQVMRRTKRQKRAVDKLARVWLVDGIETVLLIHVEFQHQLHRLANGSGRGARRALR